LTKAEQGSKSKRVQKIKEETRSYPQLEKLKEDIKKLKVMEEALSANRREGEWCYCSSRL